MIIDDNFSYFSFKPYVLTPNLIRLNETVQMKVHNLCFLCRITCKTKYPQLSSNTPSDPQLCITTESPLPLN